MGKLPPGLAAYMANKKGKIAPATSGTPTSTPMPTNAVPMTGQMLASIKRAPKGKLPAGLAKYQASRKKKGK